MKSEQKLLNIYWKALVTGLFLFLFIPSLYAQKKIRLLSANRIELLKQGGKSGQRLIGNVGIAHKGTKMTCDSAHLFQNENLFIAFNNVRVTKSDSLEITGKKMRYQGKTGKIEIEGDVQLTNGKLRLTTDKLEVDQRNNIAYYPNPSQIFDGEKQLFSDQGYYDINGKSLTFKNNVKVATPQYQLYSDTLVYQTQTEVSRFFGPTHILFAQDSIYAELGVFSPKVGRSIFHKNNYLFIDNQLILGDSVFVNEINGGGEIFGNAYIHDPKNEILMEAGYAYFKKSPQYVYLDEEPLVTQIFEGDSLFIHGDHFESQQISEDGKQQVSVYNDVKIYKSDLQAVCDSLFYTDVDSIFYFYHDPVIWNGKNQLTADEVTLTIRNQKLDSLLMIGNGFMMGEVDSVNYHQIKGRNMYGLFFENKLQKIDVKGNGQTIYFVTDEATGKLTGINRADCSNLIIKMKNNEVDDMIFLVKPSFNLYPPAKFPVGEMRLKGFNPQFHRRPTSKKALFAP